jgi:2-haloacid dehalogenase
VRTEPIDAYVFDLYGTLVDYDSLAARYDGAGVDGKSLVSAWRQKQLAYALAATVMDRYADFDTLTERAFAYVAQIFNVAHGPAERRDAVAAWASLPAFPDAAATLHGLRARGYRTAVLSNGTPAGIAATLGGAGLAPALDAVLSVDAVRAFKPRAAVYELAVRHFASRPERIAFVSSNGWDAVGAAEFGMTVTWCNRSRLPAETFGAAPARTIATLAELLD